MVKAEPPPTTAPTAAPGAGDTSAGAAAKKLTPEPTRLVKRAVHRSAVPRLGTSVFVRLGEGRQLRDPAGGQYDPALVYYLLVTTTLLRQLKAGDWVLVDPAEPS